MQAEAELVSLLDGTILTTKEMKVQTKVNIKVLLTSPISMILSLMSLSEEEDQERNTES